jgi:hypothetical protein
MFVPLGLSFPYVLASVRQTAQFDARIQARSRFSPRRSQRGAIGESPRAMPDRLIPGKPLNISLFFQHRGSVVNLQSLPNNDAKMDEMPII